MVEGYREVEDRVLGLDEMAYQGYMYNRIYFWVSS
jgi:hypothetical protein